MKRGQLDFLGIQTIVMICIFIIVLLVGSSLIHITSTYREAREDSCSKIGMRDMTYASSVGLYHCTDNNNQIHFVKTDCKRTSYIPRRYSCVAYKVDIGDYRIK